MNKKFEQWTVMVCVAIVALVWIGAGWTADDDPVVTTTAPETITTVDYIESLTWHADNTVTIVRVKTRNGREILRESPKLTLADIREVYLLNTNLTETTWLVVSNSMVVRTDQVRRLGIKAARLGIRAPAQPQVPE